MIEKLAYTPVCLECGNFDVEEIVCNIRKYGHRHFTGLWEVLPVIAKLDVGAAEEGVKNFDESWLLRYSDDGPAPRWLFKMDEKISGLKSTLESLPFIQITHCNILLQLKDVPPHFDVDIRHGELERPGKDLFVYKILLTDTKEKSFFLSFNDTKKYITLPKNRKIFVIRENLIKHGATLPDKTLKIICSIFGRVDKYRHLKLIEQSQCCYKDYAIVF